MNSPGRQDIWPFLIPAPIISSMKVPLLILCAGLASWLTLASGASAQESPVPVADETTEQPLPAPPASSMPEGEVVADPVCFNIVSRAPFTIFGTLVSNVYTTEDGSKAKHRSNFRLEEGQTTQFCTYGPFYAGRKLELVLRTLIPVFSCKTALYKDIEISGRRKPEGGTEIWAACL